MSILELPPICLLSIYCYLSTAFFSRNWRKFGVNPSLNLLKPAYSAALRDYVGIMPQQTNITFFISS